MELTEWTALRGDLIMNEHTPQELLSKWANEKITNEQAIGQLILIVKRLESEATKLRNELRGIQESGRVK